MDASTDAKERTRNVDRTGWWMEGRGWGMRKRVRQLSGSLGTVGAAARTRVI